MLRNVKYDNTFRYETPQLKLIVFILFIRSPLLRYTYIQYFQFQKEKPISSLIEEYEERYTQKKQSLSVIIMRTVHYDLLILSVFQR